MSPATMFESKSVRTQSTEAGAILVTGAGGEMGHALLDALAKRFHGVREIVAMDLRELPADRAAQASASYAGDVSDPEVAERIALKHDISEIWHLAALLSTRGEKSPELALKVNVMGSANMLKLAAESYVSLDDRDLRRTDPRGKVRRRSRDRGPLPRADHHVWRQQARS